MSDAPIVTLTMNPALDLSTAVKEVVPFTKLRCGPMRRDPGGGGINVARVADRLGAPACAVFPVGGPVGELLRRLVKAEGVSCRAVPIAGDTREDFTVFETASGKQFRFVTQGPELAPQEWRNCLDAFLAAAKTAKFAVVSGSLPPGLAPAFFAEVARGLKALGVKLALDTTGEGLKCALGEGIALIKPNQNEFADLVGEKLADAQALARAARALAQQGRVAAVALTLADEGAILATADKLWRAKAPKVEAVSTVGAGDSFLGAMVASLVKGEAIERAFRKGVAAGTAALLSPGTDLAYAAAVERLLDRVEISALD